MFIMLDSAAKPEALMDTRYSRRLTLTCGTSQGEQEGEQELADDRGAKGSD